MSRARDTRGVQRQLAGGGETGKLTEAQDDGRACVRCGAVGSAMVPTGARGSRGAQLFECEDDEPDPGDVADRRQMFLRWSGR